MSQLKISSTAKRLMVEGVDGWGVHSEALRRQSQGEDIILLSIGDPDFDTPSDIVDTATRAMRSGRTHYSPSAGELSLREAIARVETDTATHPCSVDEVVVFPGATSALFSALSCITDVGDSIVLCDPMYVGYTAIFKALGLQPRFVAADKDNGFKVDVDRFIDAIDGSSPVALINTPHNPTGFIMPEEDIRKIANHCLKMGVWLISDEVYSMFTYDRKHRSARFAVETLENLISIDCLSKSHAMSGWRVGWTLAPASLSAMLEEFAGASLFGSPQFIQDASAYALDTDQDSVKAMSDEYERRAVAMVDALSRCANLSPVSPAAGMFIMLDVRKTGLDGWQFAQQLLDQEGVSVIPGGAFGVQSNDFVRVSLTQSKPILVKAAARIESFCLALGGSDE